MLQKTMRAVVARGRHDYSLERVEAPRARGREIILEVEACGICAGDIKCFEGADRFWGGNGMAAFCEPPFIPGHELLGRVVELGEQYDGPLTIGDRVTSEQIVPCGHCRYCREGKYWLCDPHDVYGFKASLNGGFAQYVRLPEGSINYRVPEEMPLQKAILIEPYACAMHAVDRAQITKDDVVVIAGAGTLGLGMIAAAKRIGPRALISIEPVQALRELAIKTGATHAMGAWPGPGLPEVIDELSEGTGCDVYIEASGHVSAITQGLNLIKKGGRFVEFSVFSGPATVDWSIIGDQKELDLLGVSLSPNCFERTIEGIADGTLPTEGVVTHVLPLESFMEAFDIIKRREAIKIALVP